MRKIKFYVLFILFLIIPINVKAYDLRCDSSEIEYDKTFICTLFGTSGEKIGEMTGVPSSTDDLVDCTMTTLNFGLRKKDVDVGFYVEGTPDSTEYMSFSCKLTKKLSSSQKIQVKIDEFVAKEQKHKDVPKETLSTDFIIAKSFEKPEEVVVDDDLPRNTSNPNSLLKNLREKNFTFVFSRFITIYNQEVLYEVDSLDIKAIPNNDEANVKIYYNKNELNKLIVGKNIVDIHVTAPDGTVTVYTVNVTRLPRGEEVYYPDGDATLSNLIIPGYAIGFEKDKLEYTIHLTSDVNKVTVNASPTINEAKVNISSTENLKNGSLIKITVTSRDKGTTLEYKIHINKDKEKVNIVPYIIGGGAVLLVIGMLALFMKQSNSKKNSNPKVDPNAIPEVETKSLVENPTQNNATLDLSNSNVVSTATPQVQDSNLNQVTVNTPTLDLSNANVVSVQETVPQTPVVQQVTENPAVPNQVSEVAVQSNVGEQPQVVEPIQQAPVEAVPQGTPVAEMQIPTVENPNDNNQINNQ